VNIGSCYSGTAQNVNYCMTSPTMNTASAASLYVSYYRHLHTDYPNYVSSTIDVSSNGSTWTNIYANAASNFVNDLSWMPFQYNVTAHKSATFRVRFCYQTGPSTAISVGGGWNIDDVVVSTNPCP
jgi:hypothetical protein